MRHEVVAEHQVDRDGAEQLVVDATLRADPRTRSDSARPAPAPARSPAVGSCELGSVDRLPYVNYLGLHRIVSASEKIGRYSAISTNATKMPMKIMIAGLDQGERRRHPACSHRLRKTRPRWSASPAARRWIRPLRSCRSTAAERSWSRSAMPESDWPSRTILPALSSVLLQQRRAERIGGRLEALHQRDAAGQQRAQHARKLRHLVLDPDFAEQRVSASSRGRSSLARFRLAHQQRNSTTAPTRPPREQQDVIARRGADRDQHLRHGRQLRLHAGVQLRRNSAPRRSPETRSGRSPARSARTDTSAKPSPSCAPRAPASDR